MAETKRDEWRRSQSLKEKNQAVQNKMDEAMERHRKRDLGWFRATAPEYTKEEDGTITYKIKVPPKKKNNEGGLLVPREGYALGKLVKEGLERVSKEVLNVLRKKDTLIESGYYEDAIDEIDDDLVALGNKSTSEEIDEIFSILELDVTDRLPTDIIDKQNMGLLSFGEGSQIVEQEVKNQYPDFYEMFRGKGLFGDSDDLNETNKLMQERDERILQEREELENRVKQSEKDLDRTESNMDREEMEDPSLRKKKQEGGMPVDTYPNIPPEEMAEVEASQLPDNEMEDEYIDFILDESLNDEEQTYLMNALEADDQLSIIFDKLIGTASEFSGAGEVEGPGTGVSDSIPARLSDGEFVMTKKATDAIGPENLQSMMDEAEMAYDIDGGRELKMAFGGVVEDDELEDSNKDYLSKTDEEIKKVMIGANKMPSVR